MNKYIYIYILVCGLKPSETYQSVGMIILNIWKKNVPNHQAYIYIFVCHRFHICHILQISSDISDISCLGGLNSDGIIYDNVYSIYIYICMITYEHIYIYIYIYIHVHMYVIFVIYFRYRQIFQIFHVWAVSIPMV